MMSRCHCLAIALGALVPLVSPDRALAQPRQAAASSGVARARVWLVPRADSVFVFVVDPPSRRGSFRVSRVRVGAAPDTVAGEPVRALRDPGEAVARIGNDLPTVMRALAARDEAELLRRLSSDPFMGTLAAALWRNVAFALGRMWVDVGVQRGAEYEYRVTWLAPDGTLDSRHPAVVQRVRIADAALAPPAGAPDVRVDKGRATVSWSYPRYTGDLRDQVIAFTVWRAEGASGAFERVSATPVVRNDAMARLTFADSGLRTGRRYRYRLRAIDVAGREGAPGPEGSVVVADRTPPAAPVGLVAHPGDGVVALSWRLGLDPDLAGWYVERTLDLDTKWARLTPRPLPLGQPTWVDTAVAGPWQHFYRIVAVDSAGNESRPGTLAAASPLDRTPPAAPAGLAASVVRRRLSLRWRPSPSRDVIGYYVYRADDSTRLVRLTEKPIAATQFTDSGYAGVGLAPGGSYVVAVAAVDRSYNVSDRIMARAEVPDDQPPEAPTEVAPRNFLGRRIDLTWTPSPSRDVAVYLVTRSAPGDSGRALGRVAAGDRLVLRDTTSLVHGRVYTYRVVAVDGAGNRSAPATDTLSFRDFAPPSPTRHVSASLDSAGRGVTLEWEPVIDAELAGYHVYRGTLPTSATERLTKEPVRALRFVDPGGRAEHWYVIRAVDRSGNESRASDPVRGAP